MFQVSNNLIGLLNIVTLIGSLPIIAISVWFGATATSECQRFLQSPLFILGVFLLVVSLLGLVGACCRPASLLLWIYLFVMFLLIVAIFCFTIFTFIVTNKGAGKVISGRGFMEYRLGDYSNWLQKMANKPLVWSKVRSCLDEARVCRGLKVDHLLDASDFYKENLSPIQSGCCKPPTYCGFTYVNATFWTTPKLGLKSADADCRAWSNDQAQLCFVCNSCKAGVLANIKNEWKKLSIFNVSLLVILIIIYTIGCCAFRNNRANQYHRYRG